MDEAEAAAINDDKGSHVYCWRPSAQIGAPFGHIAASLVDDGEIRVRPLVDTTQCLADETHILAFTMPSSWFDTSAKQICDILHGKRVYINRARLHGNSSMPRVRVDQNTTEAYNIQFFLQLVTVLWRWNTENDDRPWIDGKETVPKPRKRVKRPKDMEGAAAVIGDSESEEDEDMESNVLGPIRSECALLIDWRRRPMCSQCQAAQSRDPWRLLFCDHVDKSGMSPVLDYTLWFVVKGWSDALWQRRVAYAAVVVMMRLHLSEQGNVVNWGRGVPVATPPSTDKKRKRVTHTPLSPGWNVRNPDYSDMWKDVQTVQDYAKIVKVHLQEMGISKQEIDNRIKPQKGVGYTHRALLGSLNPCKVYSPETALRYITSRIPGGNAQTLLAHSTMEIPFSEIKRSEHFWRKYLPHYYFLCNCEPDMVVPGMYHNSYDDFRGECVAEDAAHSIRFQPSARSQGRRTLLPMETNSEATVVTEGEERFRVSFDNGMRQLMSAFMTKHGARMTAEERLAAPVVWEYIMRKQALVKYIMYCRSSESHLSHSNVMLWYHFEKEGGNVYNPETIRPFSDDDESNLKQSPWDYYYHNLSPFGNFAVNRAYRFWDYYNIHPPHVPLICLMHDCAADATRGEVDVVRANVLIHSTDPSTGKSFIKKIIMGTVRKPGTSLSISHRSAASRHIKRMGTHDDMLVCEDEMKRRTFINKEEGGMADAEDKELLSVGKLTTQVLVYKKGHDGQEERDVMCLEYRELSTRFGSANLQLMDVKDKAYISRWIVWVLNNLSQDVVKRPCEPARPPSHISGQFYQLQYAVTEVHKMIQMGAMVVEDTYLLNIFMHALAKKFHEIGDTWRKDMHISNLARIHAIHDLVITHFWHPGGIYYNKPITPTRLASLNDFLIVKAEHIVFAIGQISRTMINENETLIRMGIRYMWKYPQVAFPVEWGTTTPTVGSTKVGTRVMLGHVEPVDVPCYDVIVFPGRTFKFIKHFASALHHVIIHNIIGKEASCSTPPTKDQIVSQLELWQNKMCEARRAELVDAKVTSCNPDNVRFLPRRPGDPSSAILMCQVDGKMGLRFPSYMISSIDSQASMITGTPLESLLRADRELLAKKIDAGMAATDRKKRRPITPDFLYGESMQRRQEYYSVLDVKGCKDAAVLPARFYTSIMSPDEFSRISGGYTPSSGEELVPLYIPLDEFAMRSRMKTLNRNSVKVTNAMFGRVFSKLVLSNFYEDEDMSEIYQTFRKTLMFWSMLYQRSGAALYTQFVGGSNGQAEDDTRDIFCEYQTSSSSAEERSGATVPRHLDPAAQIIRSHRAIYRIATTGRYSAHNAFHYYTGSESAPKRTYPNSLPEIGDCKELIQTSLPAAKGRTSSCREKQSHAHVSLTNRDKVY